MELHRQHREQGEHRDTGAEPTGLGSQISLAAKKVKGMGRKRQVFPSPSGSADDKDVMLLHDRSDNGRTLKEGTVAHGFLSVRANEASRACSVSVQSCT